MPKWLKFIIALLLLPVCFAGGDTIVRILRENGTADVMWIPLLAGATCWGVIYLLLPRPMWIYVVGHELTHVLWTWLFGGRVKRMKVSSKGGHVVVTKTNFLIALAPYFFPLYAMIVLGFLLVVRLFTSSPLAEGALHLLLGVAYAFHITLTGHVLKTSQSDVTAHGYLFSATVVFLGNAAMLIFFVPLLTGTPAPWKALKWWGTGTLHLWQQLPGLCS